MMMKTEVCGMKEMEMLEFLLEQSSGRVKEEQMSYIRDMIPELKESVLTGMDVSMSLRSSDGKEYLLDYNRDGSFQINLVSDAQRQEDAEGHDDIVDARLRKVILGILSDIRFSLKASGTTYLVEGVILVLSLKNETRRMGMTKEIYPHIARVYGVSITSVERNIRLAIETAWNKMPCEYAMAHYPYEYTSRLGRPTNQEFIYAVAGIIRRSYPEYAAWCRQKADRD